MKQIQSKNTFFPKLPFCPGILAKRNPGIGRLLILIGIAMLVVSRAEAQGVYYWGADKMVFYKQTENAQVTTGGSFSSAENFDGFQSITYFILRVVN